jgi:trehalose-6-phosphate synthase
VSRLVVVSNRVALPGENRAGGLAVGLGAALGTHGGVWFGWSGKVVREELQTASIATAVPSPPPANAIPDSALDFLNSL